MASTSRGSTDGRVTVHASMTGGRRARVASPTTALAVGVLSLLLALASVPLAVLDHQFSVSNTVAPAVVALLFSFVCVVIACRQPGNPIGWLLLGIGLALVGGTAAGSYALLAYRERDHGLPLVRVAVFLAPNWPVFIVLLPLPILLFPDGRLSSSGSRRTLVAALVIGGAFLALVISQDVPALFARHIDVNSSGELATLNHPQGLVATLYDALLLFYVAFCLAVVIRQVLHERTLERLLWRLGSLRRARADDRVHAKGAASCGIRPTSKRKPANLARRAQCGPGRLRPARSRLGDCASPRAKPASRGGLLLPALVLAAEQRRS